MIKSFKSWLNGPKDAEAQYNLGRNYANGYGVKQDYKQAAYWFRKAAEQGLAEAQQVLGFYYESGQGVAQDYQQAVKWYQKAAEQEDDIALYCLGWCYYAGRGVRQDYRQAVNCWKKAAEQGLAEAQHNLGSCYSQGKGVTQDYQQAVMWIRKAAEQGYTKAQHSLSFYYHEGKGVVQDYQQAAQWCRKAAEQGYAAAQYNLGLCYEDGQGVEQDYQQAELWYRKAAEQGDSKAQKALQSLPPTPSAPPQSQPKQSTPSAAQKAPTSSPKKPAPSKRAKPSLSVEERILNYLKKQPVKWEFPPKSQDNTLKNFCSSLVFSENVAAVYSDEVIKNLELTIQQKRARNLQIADYNAAMEGNILALLYKYSYLMHIFNAMGAVKFDASKVDMQKLWLLIQQDCNARIGNLAEEKRKNPAIQTILSKYAYDNQTMRLKVLTDATGREMDYIISSLMANSLVTVISLLFSNPQLLQTIKPYSADDISGMMDAHIATAATMKFSTYSR